MRDGDGEGMKEGNKEGSERKKSGDEAAQKASGSKR